MSAQHRRALVLHASAIALFAATPVFAQRAATTIEIAPYAGVMISGNALEGPLGTTLSNSAGAIYGAQVALKLGSIVSVIGNLGYSDPDIRAGVPIFGDVRLGSSKIWMYDGGLRLSLPGASAGLLPITPFIEGGAGVMKYDVSSGPLSAKSTNVAWNVGAGADLTISRNFGMRIFAKDYIGRFDFKDATGFDVQGETAHHVALGVGLRLDF
jgi:hypothetical protein